MFEKELQIAIQAVKKSETVFRKYHGTKTKVLIKNNNYRDLVSYADKKIESDIKKFLYSRFPEYGFIGEESGETKTLSPFCWVLDPIDGTTNYLHGSPDCAIALALLYKNKPVVGVVSAPILNLFYYATKNGGARMNGKLIQVSNTKDLKYAYGSFGWGRDINFAQKKFPTLVSILGKIRVLGSVVITICYVAQGISDFLIGSDMKIWDYAAPQIILEEAGGKLSKEQKNGVQIATNKFLGRKLLKLTKKN